MTQSRRDFLQSSITALSPSGMQACAAMPKLKALSIGQTFVSDSGVKALSASRLESLYLDNNPITDLGVRHIVKIDGLKRLSLFRCKMVTGRSVSHLSMLHSLEEVSLSGTSVDPKSLLGLRGHKNLKVLRIGGVRISESEIERLREGLPDCKIVQPEISP